MATSTTNQQQGTSVFGKFSYIAAFIGGGVVGVDYATWFEVDPLIGGGIGCLISLGVTAWLLQIYEDPDGKIKEACTSFGAFVGMCSGVYIALSNFDGAWAFVGGLLIGAGLGAVAGQILAALLSLSAFALLFISRGPIGYFLRNVLLSDQAEAPGSYQLSEVSRYLLEVNSFLSLLF